MANSTNVSYVPDSSPGPEMSSGSVREGVGVGRLDLGRPAPWRRSSWPMPSDSGPTRAYSAGTSRQVIASFAGLVATVRPSMATSSSTYSTPLASQRRDLVVVDRPGGVGDVGATLAERGEAVTRARAFDGHGQVATGQLTGELADADADRLDRRRPGHEDLATGELDVTAGSAGRRAATVGGGVGSRARRVGATGRRVGAASGGVGASGVGARSRPAPRSWRRRRHRRRRMRRGRACRRSPRRRPCGGGWRCSR